MSYLSKETGHKEQGMQGVWRELKQNLDGKGVD
jgi:hypothetical protein